MDGHEAHGMDEDLVVEPVFAPSSSKEDVGTAWNGYVATRSSFGEAPSSHSRGPRARIDEVGAYIVDA